MAAGSWNLLGFFALSISSVVDVSGDTGYITYQRGNMSLILTAPHGGTLQPDFIASRGFGCWNPAEQRCVFLHDCERVRLEEDSRRCWVVRDGIDTETKLLTRLVAEHILELTGTYPHVVTNNLRRNKLDANRHKDVASFDDPIAGEAWEEWNRYIRQAKAAIGGPGILLDIHAHDHEQARVELGYLISGPQLDSGQFDPDQSSIRSLVMRINKPFAEIMRGERSLGAMLSVLGYDTVPSVKLPGPQGEPYWFGGTPGTNTQVHGSRDGGVIDAIQIESPARTLLAVSDVSVTQRYARALARAIAQFHRMYYTDPSLREGDICSPQRTIHQRLGSFFSRVFCPAAVPSSPVFSLPYRFNDHT